MAGRSILIHQFVWVRDREDDSSVLLVSLIARAVCQCVGIHNMELKKKAKGTRGGLCVCVYMLCVRVSDSLWAITELSQRGWQFSVKRAKLSHLTSLTDALPRNLSLHCVNEVVQRKVEGIGCDILDLWAFKSASLQRKERKEDRKRGRGAPECQGRRAHKARGRKIDGERGNIETEWATMTRLNWHNQTEWRKIVNSDRAREKERESKLNKEEKGVKENAGRKRRIKMKSFSKRTSGDHRRGGRVHCNSCVL